MRGEKGVQKKKTKPRYLSDGRLAASSHAVPVPTSLSDHSWLSFQLRGYDKELRCLGLLWLRV